MVSCIPNIANAVLSFRVSHKLELTSYREVLDFIDIVAIPARPRSDAIRNLVFQSNDVLP